MLQNIFKFIFYYFDIFFVKTTGDIEMQFFHYKEVSLNYGNIFLFQ